MGADTLNHQKQLKFDIFNIVCIMKMRKMHVQPSCYRLPILLISMYVCNNGLYKYILSRFKLFTALCIEITFVYIGI